MQQFLVHDPSMGVVARVIFDPGWARISIIPLANGTSVLTPKSLPITATLAEVLKAAGLAID